MKLEQEVRHKSEDIEDNVLLDAVKAILDRIIHNAHRINLTGHSLRRSRSNKASKD